MYRQRQTDGRRETDGRTDRDGWTDGRADRDIETMETDKQTEDGRNYRMHKYAKDVWADRR